MSQLNTDFILNEWLPALRSGEYEQTEQVLHNEVGYCCLGVACDLLVKKGVLKEDMGYVYYNPETDTDAAETTLPYTAQKYIGCTDEFYFEMPVRVGESETSAARSAVDLNDSYKKTFPEIADIIERAVKGYNVRPFEPDETEEEYDDAD